MGKPRISSRAQQQQRLASLSKAREKRLLRRTNITPVKPAVIGQVSASKRKLSYAGPESATPAANVSDAQSWCLVNVAQLNTLYNNLLCPDCGMQGLTMTIGDNQGFASSLELRCVECSYSKSAFSSPRVEAAGNVTSPKKNEMAFDINVRMVVLTHELGLGYAAIQKICKVLRFPGLGHSSYVRHNAAVSGRKSDPPLSPDFVPSISDSHTSPEKRRRKTRLEVFNRKQKTKLHKTEQAKLSAEAIRCRRSTDCPQNKAATEDQITEPFNDSGDEDPVQPDPATPPCTSETCGKRIQCLELECQDLRTDNMLLKDKINRKTLTEISLHNDDKRVNALTGVATYTCLMTIFQCLAPFLKLKSSITCFEQYMLTLMKLRMNLTFDFLGFFFGVDPTTVSRHFKHCVNLIYCRLVPSLVVWPERESLRTSLPYVFRNGGYEKTVCIIDCFEIFLEKPSRLGPSAQCYSKYKSHHTMKYLIAICPQGSICFISTGWGGRTSDKFITEHSNFLQNVLPGDVVLADRGFLVKESVEMCQAELKIPAFTRGKRQLDPLDLENTISLASLRIHIERVIGVLRQKYTILQSTVPITFTDIEKENDVTYLDKIVSVCCALTNTPDSVVPFE